MTLILCPTTPPPPPDNPAVYGTMWKNIVEPNNPQMTIQTHCKLDNQATDIHSEYEILTAFPEQERLRETCIDVTLYVLLYKTVFTVTYGPRLKKQLIIEHTVRNFTTKS